MRVSLGNSAVLAKFLSCDQIKEGFSGTAKPK